MRGFDSFQAHHLKTSNGKALESSNLAVFVCFFSDLYAVCM